MPNFASLSCFYSKLRWGAFLPPPSKIGCPNTPSKIGLTNDHSIWSLNVCASLKSDESAFFNG